MLVLGEIRDDETADLAVRAALTGHSVISTLHAGSCKGVFERLLVMCPDRYAVLSVVDLVVNQRLIRRLCGACAGRGCEACLGTRYKGCVPLVEWVHLDEALRGRLRTGDMDAVVPPVSLESAARELASRGVTDAAELGRVFGQ